MDTNSGNSTIISETVNKGIISGNLKIPRIDIVDALRGFAILGIVLVHNIEHFNLYIFPENDPEVLKMINKWIWDSIFFLFGGKAYAMFAMLFGFSFFVQFTNQQAKENDYCWRFCWRMIVLAGFGWLNAVFYPGDILILYATIGIVLLPLRKASNKVILTVAVLLMLQPFEWGKFFYAFLNPDFQLSKQSSGIWDQILIAIKSPSFTEMVKFNLSKGEWYSLSWAWNNGRYFQTASLFLIGMLLGRKNLFIHSKTAVSFWIKVLIIAICCFISLYILKTYILPEMEIRRELSRPLKIIILSTVNVSFMFVLVSLFITLWFKTKFQKVLSKLIPYGKMSLTNYIGMGIIGSFLYYGYGLAIYQYLGVTFSLLTGIAMFLLQLAFSRWWLKRHRQGPLERVWHKLTWINKIPKNL